MQFVQKSLIAALALSFATFTWNQSALSHECDEGICTEDHDDDYDRDHDDDRHDRDGRHGSRLGIILGAAGLAAGGYALYTVNKDWFEKKGITGFVESIDEVLPGHFFLNANVLPKEQSLRIGIRY